MFTAKRLAALGVIAALVVPAFAAAPTQARKKAPFYNLNKVPKPNVTGKEIIAGLEEYVEKFPLRQNLLPNNVPAAEFLADEAKGYGFKTEILEFKVGTPERTVRVVQAIKKGTKKPDEWLAFVAHYDVVAGVGFTVQGAYDDGSGTNILRYFGKAFSKVKTNRSIALLWFDAEEDGLLASKAYAALMDQQRQKIKAVLGFDMVGIGYPARYCICIYHGPNPTDGSLAVPITDYVNYEHLKFPKGDGAGKFPAGAEGHVCNCGANIRNSDESSFAKQGYFTMRWTGMRTASDYPGYHLPWDTVPFMEMVAGSRDNLEKGTENTFLSAYYTTFVLDNLP
ncbi:MAG: M28 family peptidase [Actinomycetota bacterium]|nr:M28 family peptidase [Actinomycetota bacterium]